jgi:hypothetical protein
VHNHEREGGVGDADDMSPIHRSYLFINKVGRLMIDSWQSVNNNRRRSNFYRIENVLSKKFQCCKQNPLALFQPKIGRIIFASRLFEINTSRRIPSTSPILQRTCWEISLLTVIEKCITLPLAAVYGVSLKNLL